MKKIFLVLSVLFFNFSNSQTVKVIKTFDVPNSKQGVAVDSSFFYVINNSSITKHNKENGTLINSWIDKDSLINHLNSGIIINKKLYSCNSNYPESPMASSIEIFNPNTLEHIESHSFGIGYGSATWLDYYNNNWYVAFAHYTGRGSELGKNNSWTQLVKFDNDWQKLESWIFPKNLISKFGIKSNSGGIILPTGEILVTGHDEAELYVLQLPKKGYILEWTNTIPIGSHGQGIAYETDGTNTYIYGIIKKDKKVIVSKIK